MSAGKYHIVVQGDYLSKIAREAGFASFLTIWDASENKQLKELRKNPNVLFPGDRLFVPAKETKEESAATGKRHRFELQSEKLFLRIVLKDLKNQPLEGNDCTLSIETDSKILTSSSQGMLEREIIDPRAVAKGLLLDRGRAKDAAKVERQIPLRIGDLDPETTVSGQIARLNNLGYNAGEVPPHPLTPEEEKKLIKSLPFRSAVEEFQCDHLGMDSPAVIKQVVDGVCGEKTAKKLKEVHGC